MATTPMFPPDQDMMDVSPEDVAEAKRRAKATAMYNKLSTIPPSPKASASAPKPAASAASSPKKMAKGGYVRAADGCAQRGKTRGKMM